MMNVHKTINISSANSSLQTTFATYKRQLKKKKQSNRSVLKITGTKKSCFNAAGMERDKTILKF